MKASGIAKRIIILLLISIILIIAKIVIASTTNNEETHNVRILDNKNYWCVQRGAHLGDDTVTYKVSDSFKSKDPIFDYIISRGKDAEGVDYFRYRTPAQVALWIYLNNNGTYKRLTWPSDEKGTVKATGFTTKGEILNTTNNYSSCTRTRKNVTDNWSYNLGETFIYSDDPKDDVSSALYAERRKYNRRRKSL